MSADLALEWEPRLPRKAKKALKKMIAGVRLTPREDKLAFRWLGRAVLTPTGEVI